MWTELNIDALVGPTHHFGGLGVGNVASLDHQNQISHPRRAALEGLRKAELVAGLGVPQWVWLPPQRPCRNLLTDAGFTGNLEQQIKVAAEEAPRILAAAMSSAFMWAANSATVTPACDAADGCYHATPANLISSWHRASEAAERQADLEAFFTFANQSTARVHRPLPPIVPLRDEGAANHMRLCDREGGTGFHVFVYGASEHPLVFDNFLN